MTAVFDEVQRSGVLWLGPSRAFYTGELGNPSERIVGCCIIYTSLDSPFSIQMGDKFTRCTRVAVTPAYMPHRITLQHSQTRIAAYMIEPDSVETTELDEFVQAELRRMGNAKVLLKLREMAAHLQTGRTAIHADETILDKLIFGRRLTPRTLDRRVATILTRMRANPSGRFAAEECAGEVHLSFSRFLHLFKEEVGISFRQLRAWRRARQFMGQVNSDDTLTSVAIDLGYPDASHFSHSIRQVYGLKPRDVCAAMHGSSIIVPPAASPTA